MGQGGQAGSRRYTGQTQVGGVMTVPPPSSHQLNSCVSMQQLKYHGVVTWLNPPEELAKGWRKGQGPDMQCFSEGGVWGDRVLQ